MYAIIDIFSFRYFFTVFPLVFYVKQLNNSTEYNLEPIPERPPLVDLPSSSLNLVDTNDYHRASGGQATTTVGTGDRCDVSYRSRLGDTDAVEKSCTYLLEGNQLGITNTRQGRFADGDANFT
jgi:hypothetical protein